MTIILFILILAILVLAHEWGHFVAARRAGVKVEEFGFGFPPRITSVKKGETRYSINWIPLGGFVKIFGEEGEGKDDPQSFQSKAIGTRAKIIAAGVIMNVVLTA
ncbi:site-2 protease family protein, partial [Candidatus Azambacteria bacterium]|nr:site-2 protease family protein [Candidatus Azambacteria bacterium]